MDLGLVGIEGLVAGQNTAATGVLSLPSEQPQQKELLEGKPNCNGSGSIKHERSDPLEDGGFRASKVPKRVDDLRLRSNENDQPKQQMLSFSSSATPEFSFLTRKDVGLIDGKNAQNISLSYYKQSASPRCSAGFGSENLIAGIHGSLTGIRGPFTPAQWIELEHQAMIYKYISANVPVPTHLLIPVRKALSSSGFPGFSAGSYPTQSYGWGSFHLGFGFSGSTDPEPGRCRRTDGKKWRCSRDAVPDQKYCERHINRGRHRSRKPVEGQVGQAASGPTSSKVVPAISTPMPSLVTSSGGVSSSVTIAQHQIKGFQPAGAANSATDPTINRFHDQQGLSMMHPTINLKSKDSPFSIPEQRIPYDDSLESDFGFVSNDSLLNPSEKLSYLSCKSYNSLLEFDTQQVQDQGALKPFMIDWPEDQSNHSATHWPQELKPDWTQLSMSIPTPADFSSSSSSPKQDLIGLSQLRLSRDVDPSQMGLGVGTVMNETGTKPNAWLPIALGNSMGGPLAEVLNNQCSPMGGCKSKDGSPQLGSSPTGILQKAPFVSLSNSSSGGCSRRVENKKAQEEASLRDDVLCSAQQLIASLSSIPSM